MGYQEISRYRQLGPHLSRGMLVSQENGEPILSDVTAS